MHFNTIYAFYTLNNAGILNLSTPNDYRRPKITDPDFQKNRQKYQEMIDKEINVLLNKPALLTTKEANRYLDIAYSDERNWKPGFKKPHLRELSPKEKAERKNVQKKAAIVLHDFLLEASNKHFDYKRIVDRRETIIAEKKRKDKKYVQSVITRGTSVIINFFLKEDYNDFLEKDEKYRADFFLDFLQQIEKSMEKAVFAKTDDEFLDFCKTDLNCLLLAGDLDGSKLNGIAQNLGVSKNPAVIEKMNQFIKSHSPIAANLVNMTNRLSIMADPLYGEIEISDFLGLQKVIREAANGADQSHFRAEDYLVEKGFMHEDLFPGSDAVKQITDKGEQFKVIDDLRNIEGFIYMGDRKYSNSEFVPNDMDVGTVQSYVKFYLEVICGEEMDKVAFYDPENPQEPVKQENMESLFSDMVIGKKALYQGKDGFLRQIEADPVLLQLAKPHPMVTLNPNSKWNRQFAAAEALTDLDKVQSYSITATKEFKRLDTAVRQFAKSGYKTKEDTMKACEAIVKAAKDYITLKRFPEKEMNEKTYARLDFAKKMYEKFVNANALGVIDHKKIYCEPSLDEMITKTTSAIAKREKGEAIRAYAALKQKMNTRLKSSDAAKKLKNDLKATKESLKSSFFQAFDIPIYKLDDYVDEYLKNQEKAKTIQKSPVIEGSPEEQKALQMRFQTENEKEYVVENQMESREELVDDKEFEKQIQ